MTTYSTFAQRYNNQLVTNNAGGEVYALTDLQVLHRFLILGSASNTYYVHKNTLLEQNVDVVREILTSKDNIKALDLLRKVSVEGLAPKLSPTILVLALAFASSKLDTKKYAAKIFPEIIRTQAHLFEFLSYVRSFRGMGRLLRNTIRYWYQNQTVENLAYQMIKYRNRHGYKTRDVLRLAKPKATTEIRNELYAFGAEKHRDTNIEIIEAFKQVQASTEPCLELITKFRLPWEALPTIWLNEKSVWKTMLPTMPLMALIRNLGKMTSIGLLELFSDEAAIVIERLSDELYIKASRLHPFNILLAWATYRTGQGIKGSLRWEPNHLIVAALERAFYMAFANVEPANKRTLIGLDVSGSMSQEIMGTSLSTATAAAAMTLITVKTEPKCIVKGFSYELVDLNITSADTLHTIAKKTVMPFGPTDCSALILWATKHNIPVDTFIVYTDCETGERTVPTRTAIKNYRKKTGINAKVIVVGMTATRLTIADPLDSNMLDVVGFDSSAPAVISSFSKA